MAKHLRWLIELIFLNPTAVKAWAALFIFGIGYSTPKVVEYMSPVEPIVSVSGEVSRNPVPTQPKEEIVPYSPPYVEKKAIPEHSHDDLWKAIHENQRQIQHWHD